MYIIDEQDNITLTRGNTFKTNIYMEDASGNPYTPGALDVIVFMLHDFDDPDTPVLSISVPYNTCLLHIAPLDTAALDTKNYFYDVTITTASGDVDTFIGPQLFTLLPGGV